MPSLTATLSWQGHASRGAFAAVFALSTLMGVALTQSPSLGRVEAWAALGLGLTTPLYFAVARQRLRDLGWSGRWMWALPIPFVSLPLVILLIGWPGARRQPMPGRAARVGPALVMLLALFYASRVAWHPYVIPAGSMKPTLRPDDIILASRLMQLPEPGDVVIFRHPVDDTDYIKRVIGRPGDRLRLYDGQVILNGTPLRLSDATTWQEPYVTSSMGPLPLCQNRPSPGGTCTKTRWTEHLPNGANYHILDFRHGVLGVTKEILVPEGHVFVLGDNRDNSVDSRLAVSAGGIGLVPMDRVVGRAWQIVYRAADGLIVEKVK